jgi:hypothetical protein
MFCLLILLFVDCEGGGIYSSETSVNVYQATWCDVPEGSTDQQTGLLVGYLKAEGYLVFKCNKQTTNNSVALSPQTKYTD